MLEKTSFKNKGYVGRYWSFPSGSDGKESACIVGVLDSIAGSRRLPGERNGYPLQYSCLENPRYIYLEYIYL